MSGFRRTRPRTGPTAVPATSSEPRSGVAHHRRRNQPIDWANTVEVRLEVVGRTPDTKLDRPAPTAAPVEGQPVPGALCEVFECDRAGRLRQVSEHVRMSGERQVERPDTLAEPARLFRGRDPESRDGRSVREWQTGRRHSCRALSGLCRSTPGGPHPVSGVPHRAGRGFRARARTRG